jgi:hypothetical protein
MRYSKALNLIDLARFRKDFLWGKEYFALIEDHQIIASIIYSQYLASTKIHLIEKIDQQESELLEAYTAHFSSKRRCRYFIAKFDEVDSAGRISFFRENGFLRLNREYHFNFKLRINNQHVDHIDMLCFPATKRNLKKLVQVSKSAQALEYRDLLYHSKKYLKSELDNIYFFKKPESKAILGYVIIQEHEDSPKTVEFTLAPAFNDDFIAMLKAFIDAYVCYEMCEDFIFIVSENQKDLLEQLEKNFELLKVMQILVKEGMPKSKIGSLKKWTNKVRLGVPNGQVANNLKTASSIKQET